MNKISTFEAFSDEAEKISAKIQDANPPRYLVCIDPGVKTGIALYDYDDRKIKHVTTKEFWGAHDYVVGHFTPAEVLILIESSESNGFMWNAKGQGVRAAVRVARSVGQNNREASLLQQRLTMLGYRCALVKPKNTKKSAAYVAKLSGWNGKTNEHNRDAIMMCLDNSNRQLFMARMKFEETT
ncbi:MAG: hypothetical protein KDJ38_18490 [Gammaproteobacteria bacterium]|nr:hypothetical protein [Gammaproteobacteria bacterium]